MWEDGRLAADVVVICTANRCRSVMAAAFLSRRLDLLGVGGSVRSAGIGTRDQAPPHEVVSVMAAYGLDVSRHCARQVTAADLGGPHLIIGMAREHVRHAAVAAPRCWARAFTLKEIVRRGRAAGQRMPGESFSDWLGRVHDGRDQRALLGDCLTDDIEDPIGGPPEAYASIAAEIDWHVSQLTELCWDHRAPMRAMTGWPPPYEES